jgi:hypothetical protein
MWKRHFKIYDHIGSLRAELKENGSGYQVLSQTDYEPYGSVLWQNGIDERLSFIGKEKDNESSLGDFGVRKSRQVGTKTYDDLNGRFFQLYSLWL